MFGLSFANKYVLYGAIALIATVFITGYALIWKHTIIQQAMLEYNNKQLEQVITEQKKFSDNMAAVAANQSVIIEQLNAKNAELSEKLSTIDSYLNSKQATKDSRPSSSVLKNTIKQLTGE